MTKNALRLAVAAAGLALAPLAISDMRPGFPKPPSGPIARVPLPGDVPLVSAKTLEEALQALEVSVAEAGKLLDAGKAAGVKHEAAMMRSHAGAMPRLAGEGGLADDTVAKVARRARSLDAAAVRLDAAAGRDMEVARRAQRELLEALTALRQIVPGAEAAYACPMCPGVSASSAAKCPKCGMDLVKAPPSGAGGD